MSRPIDQSEAIAFFTALKSRESPLAFWSFDTSSGKQLSLEGYVNSINPVWLEIDSLQGESTLVVLIGAQFVQLDLDEAPPPIKAIAKDSFDFVLGFQAGKYACCVMARNPRNTAAAE
jgi:hypothetical protein